MLHEDFIPLPPLKYRKVDLQRLIKLQIESTLLNTERMDKLKKIQLALELCQEKEIELPYERFVRFFT